MTKRFTAAVLMLCLISLCAFSGGTSATGYTAGDVNGDGVTGYEDAQLVFDYVAGVGTLGRAQLTAADLNGDGCVTISDAAQIFHFVAGLLSDLPYTEKSGGRLTVATLPDRIEYTEGDSFEPDGMTVSLIYPDGTSEAIADYTVSGYEPTPGVKIIIITYQGARTAFTVTVYPKEITEIIIASTPKKTEYSIGEAFDATGLRVTAVYADGTEKEITEYALDGFGDEPGEYEISVFASGCRASFKITVKG